MSSNVLNVIAETFRNTLAWKLCILIVIKIFKIKDVKATLRQSAVSGLRHNLQQRKTPWVIRLNM